MTHIVGHFVENTTKTPINTLELGFSGYTRGHIWKLTPQLQRRNFCLFTQFLVSYVCNLLKQADAPPAMRPDEDYTIRYVSHELIENIVYYHEPAHAHYNTLKLLVYKDCLLFYGTNSINTEQLECLNQFIDSLGRIKPKQLYFEHMEANAATLSSEGVSPARGLGLLSLICDYDAEIGWKFENPEAEPSVTTVTTMVKLSR